MTVDLSASGRTSRTNPLAKAPFVCGIVQFFGLLPAGVAAVILGHIAQGQIRRTGDDGYNLAIVGLILGYIGLSLAILGTVVRSFHPQREWSASDSFGF